MVAKANQQSDSLWSAELEMRRGVWHERARGERLSLAPPGGAARVGFVQVDSLPITALMRPVASLVSISAGSGANAVTHRRSAIHGRGVFARHAIPDGTRILEYTGERITKAEAGRREAQRLERQARGGDDSVYVFVLNRRYDLDGREGGSVARFINHSCAPNCRPEVSRGRIWIVARRDIAVGDELTFDYGFPFAEWRRHPCRCGAARCAGFIVGNDQRWRLRRIPRRERQRHRTGTKIVTPSA